ncbi:hypothetical protein JL100_014445 [Skermanella mucosa]|uniref:hypothetical protein n=1 Tax=Skermanella mucosa TaxID=1789672 RepID=UPI00192C0B46|nr:hypothetical protein [Skermanella mucosa]UEM23886.1 hypothetical protein JL100_014445 [Skermanella mucosa]
MANRRITPHFGSGGSDGSARKPPVAIATMRGTRHLGTPANDNRPPLRLRLIRLAKLALLIAAVGGMLWYLLRQ